MKKTDSPEKIQQEAQDFQSSFKTILLGTTSLDGLPDASYTPHFQDTKGELYIFISQLAQHTNNLIETHRSSVLFIANENDTRNLFARQRLTLTCSATVISPSDEQYENILQQLEEKQGNMIGMLKTLPDFTLVQLTPINGRYVRGFGNAWDIEGADLKVLNLSTGK